MQPVETPRIYSGRYELTHLVARGGMAQVYRAVDRQLDRPVALKVLFPELSVDRAFVERFRREAQAAANLSHPNIVPVFDWGEDDGTYFIVMEYVEGRPLSAVLRDPDRLPPRQIATIGASVAAALAFAHRHSVVHRDVKPGNVLITPEGEVKVTDFGIARAVNTEESLTQTGAVMGTAAYFSPEQAEGKVVDARSDIYSLGVVLYEMCVGKPPFTGDSPVAVASKHVRDMPVLPRAANPSVPAALEAVVMKAMSKNPDDRYGSAEEFRADLLRFADGRPVEAVDPGTTSMMTAVGAAATTQAVMTTGRTQVIPPVDPGQFATQEDLRRRRRNRWLVALLILLLVALGVLGFFLLRSVGVFGGNVTVPNVVGETEAVATQQLQNDHLTVGTTTSRASTSAKGTVLSTNPAGGVSVSKNSAVNLVLSAGPSVPIVQVPSVAGQQLAAAIQQLQAAGLSYTVKYTTSDKPEGTVLSQNPAGGSHVRANVPIVLTVSGTQTSVSVPSVLGQSPTNAGALLTRAGLTIGTQTSACSSQFGTGLVSSQSPAGGVNVQPNAPVNLVISSGSCASVPNVVGQTAASAVSAITGAGLVANQTTDTTCANNAQSGNVDSQNPGAGAQVGSGTTVTITICQSTSTTTSSSSTTSSTSSTTTTTTPPAAQGGPGGQGPGGGKTTKR
jgi:beta-lactam-binding protein with PASTA domain/tRNA A-37 threonylcarbamoyl transferase component Bud32